MGAWIWLHLLGLYNRTGVVIKAINDVLTSRYHQSHLPLRAWTVAEKGQNKRRLERDRSYKNEMWSVLYIEWWEVRHSTDPSVLVQVFCGFRHTLLDLTYSPPTQTFLGVRHAFLPHERLLNRKINSFPIVRKYQLEITCRLSEIQSALLKSKCWQAKHILTSSVECDAWPKIFDPDENLGDKRWVFVYFSL